MKGKTMKYLAFDIEIAKDLPEGEPDWKQHRPLGITCAATFAAGERSAWAWCNGQAPAGA